MRIKLITGIRPGSPDWAARLLEQKQKYAALHGYAFTVDTSKWESVSTGKLRFIRSQMHTADWIAWLDQDVVIAKDANLESFVRRGSVVLASRLYCVDPGVMLFANDEKACRYLKFAFTKSGQHRDTCTRACHHKCTWFMALTVIYTKSIVEYPGDRLCTCPENPNPEFCVHPGERPDKDSIISKLLSNCSRGGFS